MFVEFFDRRGSRAGCATNVRGVTRRRSFIARSAWGIMHSLCQMVFLALSLSFPFSQGGLLQAVLEAFCIPFCRGDCNWKSCLRNKNQNVAHNVKVNSCWISGRYSIVVKVFDSLTCWEETELCCRCRRQKASLFVYATIASSPSEADIRWQRNRN